MANGRHMIMPTRDDRSERRMRGKRVYERMQMKLQGRLAGYALLCWTGKSACHSQSS